MYTTKLKRIAEGSELLQVCWNLDSTLIIGFVENRLKRAYDHQEPLVIGRIIGVTREVEDFHIILELPVSVERQFGKFVTLEHHPRQALLVLIWENQVQIWHYEKRQFVAARSFGRNLRGGGFYPDEQRIWLLPVASSGSVEWATWDYSDDIYQEFSLERNGEYGRGAALHPSGKLIGACWCGSGCGYHIHLDSDQRKLSYYMQPAAALNEYENYLPVFSQNGGQFAFVSNPYQDKQGGNINIYEVETGKHLFSIPTGIYLQEQNLQFVEAGRAIAFSSKNDLFIHHLFPRESPTKITAHTGIKHFSASPLLPQYALALNAGWLMLVTKNTLDSPYDVEQYQEGANEIALHFVEANQPYLRVVNEEAEDD